jgi:hypothetical protein
LPIHRQHRYRHREPEADSAVPDFASLAEDPVPVLRGIAEHMRMYRDQVWQEKIDELAADSAEDAEEARSKKEQFEEEIRWFDQGISVLENNEEALRAFKLMNETFDQKVMNPDGSRDYRSWRLFQIVFLVSNIPDIIVREDTDIEEHRKEEVSLLWFPTGGGKTEAYLGLVVMSMFFDRIRGKDLGLTSMMRYPLRLLSLQQFQRITELFMYADEIRQRENDLGGDQFSIGYLTGGTENKMRDVLNREFSYNAGKNSARDSVDKVRELAQRWESGDLRNISKDEFRFVNRCPHCGSSVNVEVNTDDIQIDHVCSDDDCDWDRLPVHVLDNEIYRSLPTMVIGTQDKLAALGYERKFRLLLGYVKARCPEHGYTDGTECTEKYFCNHDPEDHIRIHPKDPVPTLQIQDELHLVKEELGTFESHYWGAMEQLISWADYPKPKLIAATATIEGFDHQIDHLYQRNGYLFPSPGPSYRESFYATEDEDEIQRYFLGVTPWNRSHINTVVSVLETHQKIVQKLKESPEKLVTEFEFDDFNTVNSSDELQRMLRFYETEVNYVISKKEGSRLYQSVETQINEDLKREGYDEISRLRLTGDTSFGDVADMLDRYEELADDPDMSDETEDLMIATSTISHGVDLNALNFMVFFGMPRRTAEYIQSSSRVGRQYPGIVVDVFHPIRERDRSHFHYFDKYHEYLDRLVEPVPVNRWAKFSIQRTLPGLFMSLILQRYYGEIYHQIEGSPYMTKTVAKAHSEGIISKEKLIDALCEIYGTDKRGTSVFREPIETGVQRYVNAIDQQQKKFVSDTFPDNERPMFSLRDVDVPVDIFTNRQHGQIVHNLDGGMEGDN